MVWAKMFCLEVQIPSVTGQRERAALSSRDESRKIHGKSPLYTDRETDKERGIETEIERERER